jgi:hypothetical protein
MSVRFLAVPSAALLFPAVAVAQPLTGTLVFAHAHPLQKGIAALLVLSMLAAGWVTVDKLRSASKLSGGSAFVSGLRLGGPIIGALGAAYAVTDMAIGVANVSVPPTLKLLAPGLAEAGAMLWLGCLAGTVGVIANWAIESRIDRQVLTL